MGMLSNYENLVANNSYVVVFNFYLFLFVLILNVAACFTISSITISQVSNWSRLHLVICFICLMFVIIIFVIITLVYLLLFLDLKPRACY